LSGALPPGGLVLAAVPSTGGAWGTAACATLPPDAPGCICGGGAGCLTPPVGAGSGVTTSAVDPKKGGMLARTTSGRVRIGSAAA
jgi:hypothetical protein